jgi:hypothetical protein
MIKFTPLKKKSVNSHKKSHEGKNLRRLLNMTGKDGGMDQVVQSLPSKHEAQSSSKKRKQTSRRRTC